jgi:hypothetical protein
MPFAHRGFWIFPLLVGSILALFSLLVSRTGLKRVYYERFPESRRERLFLASVGFFTCAVVVRGVTLAIHYNVGPFHDISMGGRHIHHMVWGILLLLTVGYSWLIEIGTGSAATFRWIGRLTSMLYGVAAALTLDEFALWLNLKDVYWEHEGRASLEALAAFGGALAVSLIGRPFFHGIFKEFIRSPKMVK